MLRLHLPVRESREVSLRSSGMITECAGSQSIKFWGQQIAPGVAESLRTSPITS